MKIVNESSSRLVLADFPCFSAACCMVFLVVLVAVVSLNPGQFFGAKRFVIAGFGLFAFVLLLVIAKKTEVVLDRGLNRFSLARRGLFGTRRIEFALSDISSVAVQELSGVKPSDYFRRVAVLGPKGWIPLTGYWHNRKNECRSISVAIGRILDRG